jgi:hypothetical protein
MDALLQLKHTGSKRVQPENKNKTEFSISLLPSFF